MPAVSYRRLLKDGVGMSKGYEERYLLILLSAVMNQKEPPEPLRQLSWEKVFRLADYHHVAHVVYYGIMGVNGEIPKAVRERFYEKYLEAVLRVERLKKGEKEIRTLLEREAYPSILFDYSMIVECYPIEEMCCREAIEVAMDRKSVDFFEKTLKKVDFEKRRAEAERLHFYYRIPGTRVLFYDYKLFFSRPMRKYYRKLMETLPTRKGCRFIRELPVDDQYLFSMCRLTDCYARGEISLNQIMDFWAFYKKYAGQFSWPYIYEQLKKFKIAEFAERLETLILRWFGTGVKIENMEVYEAMESYILSKGAEGREVSSQLLPLIKTVADCYARDRRREELIKRIKWMFPDRKYMETIYPVLEYAQYLLWLFWIVRLVRYALRFIGGKIREKQQEFVEKVPPLKKLLAKLKKKSVEKLASMPVAGNEAGEQPEAEKQNNEEEKTTEIP